MKRLPACRMHISSAGSGSSDDRWMTSEEIPCAVRSGTARKGTAAPPATRPLPRAHSAAGGSGRPVDRLHGLAAVLALVSLVGCSGGITLAGEGADARADIADVSGDFEHDEARPACGNGLTEPGEECDGEAPRACPTNCGTIGGQSCVACLWGPCDPPDEECNGRDDDCDDGTDEDFECPAGTAAPCFAADCGWHSCSSACAWGPCTARSPERCNDADDDCDGRTDESQWCWVNPKPTGIGFEDAWAAAENDVWAVGWNGGIARWDGWSWSPMCSGTQADLEAVWGASPDDVWIGTWPGHFLRWNGTEFAAYELGARVLVTGIWGAGPADIWAVWGGDGSGEDRGGVWHWDGSVWASVLGPVDQSLLAVWGRSAADVWAVGTSTTAYHWDGGAWTLSTTDAEEHSLLTAVWGAAPGDVWAVGRHWNSSGIDEGRLLHWDGTAWSRSRGEWWGLSDVVGYASNDVWAVGDSARIWHWDGSVWLQHEGGVQRSRNTLTTYGVKRRLPSGFLHDDRGVATRGTSAGR
ncbi:MAG: hypothetical protein HY905_07575 [Deltaproteobacteria bacterium]|nr:hypothetical protein [Deltaproteobacteria bacterium]